MRHYFTQTKSSLSRGGSQLISKSILPFISLNQTIPNALESSNVLKASGLKSTGFELRQGNTLDNGV
jgi:hypothetical protein